MSGFEFKEIGEVAEHGTTDSNIHEFLSLNLWLRNWFGPTLGSSENSFQFIKFWPWGKKSTYEIFENIRQFKQKYSTKMLFIAEFSS